MFESVWPLCVQWLSLIAICMQVIHPSRIVSFLQDTDICLAAGSVRVVFFIYLFVCGRALVVAHIYNYFHTCLVVIVIYRQNMYLVLVLA